MRRMSPAQLFAVVLAAGTSSRFGAMKQLESWRDQPLVRQAIGLAEHACGDRRLLVVGHRWHDVVAACRPVTGFFAVNEAYTEGIGASIRCGVRRVAHAADAVLLLLADQPLLTPTHLDRLVTCWRESPDAIVASRYEDVVGPPVVFPKRDFAALSALTGDSGARQVVAAAGERVIAVDCADAAFDVDRPADLAKAKEKDAGS